MQVVVLERVGHVAEARGEVAQQRVARPDLTALVRRQEERMIGIQRARALETGLDLPLGVTQIDTGNTHRRHRANRRRDVALQRTDRPGETDRLGLIVVGHPGVTAAHRQRRARIGAQHTTGRGIQPHDRHQAFGCGRGEPLQHGRLARRGRMAPPRSRPPSRPATQGSTTGRRNHAPADPPQRRPNPRFFFTGLS